MGYKNHKYTMIRPHVKQFGRALCCRADLRAKLSCAL